MNGALDSAYATLAQLKVALPLAQAASMESEGRVAEGTVLTLVDLTREITERLTQNCFAKLSQLDFERRSRLLRSVAQEVALLVGRRSERGEQIDTAHFIEYVRIAIDAVQSVPGAKVSLPFTDTLGARVKWELAVSNAAARLTESMMDDPSFCVANINTLLSSLLDRVNRAAGDIKTNNHEERLTVRLSLLNHFSKSHARLISRLATRVREAGRQLTTAEVLKKIDVYHVTLSTAMLALEAPETKRTLSQAAAGEISSFSPEI